MTDMADNPELRVRERGPGAVLAAARTAQNLSIADVARQLKLSASQVAALEAGEYERLPGPVRAGFRNLANVSRELQRYLMIKTAMSAAIGLTVGLWVASLGVDFAVLCGLLAFAFHFVPNVGAVLASLPAMVLAFVQYDLPKAALVGIGYLVVGFVLGNLAEPALLGRRLNFSPLAVFGS